MFHEITDRERARRRRKRIGVTCLILIICVVAALAYNAVHLRTREQGAVALRSSILNAAKQCCAIEGSYPSSLTHLEEQYGITVNHEDYVVSYECFADNIMPSVVVTPR